MSEPQRVVPALEYEQLVRLAEFRVLHPAVVVGELGFDWWQARIPEENGETVVTRRTLPELLDRLAVLLASGR